MVLEPTSIAANECFHSATEFSTHLNCTAISSFQCTKKVAPDDSDVGQALKQEKITALVEGFRAATLFDFTFLMAFTGMRRGDALALRWSDGGVEVDLSLVRIPDDWLIFPAPDGQPDEPRPAS
jgi:hypothetical protein